GCASIRIAGGTMQTFIQDLRYALRMLKNKPGFSTVAVLTMALGIGANTAIFSVVNGVLLRPLPYAKPGKLVRIYTAFPTMGLKKFWMSPPEFLDIKNEANSWESVGAWTTGGGNLTTSGEPIRVNTATVTSSLIDTLGVQPALGRNFTSEEDLRGGPRMALISDGLWRRAVGGGNHIVGREIQVDSQPGSVMRGMPVGYVVSPGSTSPSELFTTFQYDPANPGGRGNHFLNIIGRLKPDVSVEQAQAEIVALAEGWRSQGRSPHLLGERHPVVMLPLHNDIVASAKPAVLMLLGAVGFVLLIACVNVANLLLARAEARRREFAVRLALGAQAARLMRQFMTEGLILVFLGATAGVVLARVGLRAVLTLGPDSVPRTADIGIDMTVLVFTIGISVISVLVFALAPIMQMRQRDLATVLRGTGQRTSGGSSSHALRKSLVVAEIALAVVPVIGSGLMIRAFWKLNQVGLGFEPRGVLSFSLQVSPSAYQAADRLRFSNELEDKLRAQPGVKSAALVSGLAPLRPINANDTDIEDYQATPDGPAENVDYWNFVSESYFDTMGIRTMEGRVFERGDRNEAAQKVVVINQAMARRFWQGSPIGRRGSPGGFAQQNQQPTWFTVIGVVEDTKNIGVDKPAGTELYFLQPQLAAFGIASRMNFVVRTDGDPQALAAGIRTAVRDLDPAVPVYAVRTMG